MAQIFFLLCYHYAQCFQVPIMPSIIGGSLLGVQQYIAIFSITIQYNMCDETYRYIAYFNILLCYNILHSIAGS